MVFLWGLCYRNSMNLNFSFSLISVSGLGACIPDIVWLVWILSQLVCLPWFLCTFLPVREFWTHSRVYTRFSMPFLCIHAGLLQKVMYALSFSFYRKLNGCWVSFDDCWVSFDTTRICIHLCFWLETFCFRVNFFLKNVLVMAFSIFCLGLVH